MPSHPGWHEKGYEMVVVVVDDDDDEDDDCITTEILMSG